MQLGVRFYDPEVGRFTQRDRIRTVVSDYAYVAGKPHRLVDPSGYTGVGGNNGNMYENACSLKGCGFSIKNARCAEQAGQEAMAEVVARLGGMIDNTFSNAVLHCTMSCKMAAHCGRDVALCVTNNHEKYNWDPKRGSMDLWNNGVGIDIADNGLYAPAQFGSCLDACIMAGITDRLRWFDPQPNRPFPVYPKYPGGNK
jgi:hypothetical protein